MSKCKKGNERNFMMRWMSKEARMDSANFLVLAQPVDDKDVSESASKMKNDEWGGAVAEGVDLVSLWCRIGFPTGHPHPTINNRGLQKCQLGMLLTSVKNLDWQVVNLEKVWVTKLLPSSASWKLSQKAEKHASRNATLLSPLSRCQGVRFFD